MEKDCIQCINDQAEKLLKRFHINGNGRSMIFKRLDTFLNQQNTQITAPEGAQYLNQMIKELSGIPDLFAVEKIYYNRFLLDKFEFLKKAISARKPKEKALRLALAANIIDFGQPNANFDIDKILKKALKKKPVIDHTEDLLNAVSTAKTVLYLGDNAGEIVADKLFIEVLAHPNIYFAVRGGYVLNDATLEDANWTGMNQVAKVVDNGYNAPATILEKCSERFIRIFNMADIVIAKGQGNLESLLPRYDKNIFFLSMIKCQVMAELVGVNVGDAIVWHNQIKQKEFADKPSFTSFQNN